MLDARTIDDLKAWFDAYVAAFTSENGELQRNFDLKKEHTARVCTEILALGRRLGLDAGQLRMAEITALFHDLGRFEQYARYGTFADSRSVDHARLGVQILREKKILDGLEEAGAIWCCAPSAGTTAPPCRPKRTIPLCSTRACFGMPTNSISGG